MNRLRNIHPGEVLLEEFLRPLGISQYRLAVDTGMTQTTVSQIVRGARAITAETALRFSRYFGTSPQFWMGLQNDYDFDEAQRNKRVELEKIRKMPAHVIDGSRGPGMGHKGRSLKK